MRRGSQASWRSNSRAGDRRSFAAWPPDAYPRDLCLAFAWEGYRIIKEWPGAPRTLIQAGSAGWPRIPPHLDDGVSPTHFAYEGDPDSGLARLAADGIFRLVEREDGRTALSLPEMHVWLGCPDTGELLDFTTGLWPQACQAILGLPWLAPGSDWTRSMVFGILILVLVFRPEGILGEQTPEGA